jgi:hypothetical protein
MRAILAHTLAAAGRGEEALEICATLEQDFAEGRAGALSLVPALAELGKRERALELLREGVRRREPFVVWVATDPGPPTRARGRGPGRIRVTCPGTAEPCPG